MAAAIFYLTAVSAVIAIAALIEYVINLFVW